MLGNCLYHCLRYLITQDWKKKRLHDYPRWILACFSIFQRIPSTNGPKNRRYQFSKLVFVRNFYGDRFRILFRMFWTQNQKIDFFDPFWTQRAELSRNLLFWKFKLPQIFLKLLNMNFLTSHECLLSVFKLFLIIF